METAQPIDFAKKTANPFFDSVFDVTPADVLENKEEVLLIDVRQPDEFVGELGHVPGSELIPLGILPQRLGELPKDKSIVLICRSGNRSAQAAAFAHENGFTHVFNMLGGMILWNENGFEIQTEE